MYTGADLTYYDAESAAALIHPALRAINAGAITGVPDNSVIDTSNHPQLQTWLADYKNGTMTLGLFNLDDDPRAMRWHTIGFEKFSAVDVWSGQNFECSQCEASGETGELQLAPHACLLLRLTMHT